MCARLTRTGVQLARPRPLQNERYSLDYEHLKIGNEDSVLAWFNQNVGARSLSTPLSSTLYLSVAGMDKHTQKPKQTQVSVSPMKRTNMSLCVFMFQCLNI